MGRCQCNRGLMPGRQALVRLTCGGCFCEGITLYLPPKGCRTTAKYASCKQLKTGHFLQKTSCTYSLIVVPSSNDVRTCVCLYEAHVCLHHLQAVLSYQLPHKLDALGVGSNLQARWQQQHRYPSALVPAAWPLFISTVCRLVLAAAADGCARHNAKRIHVRQQLHTAVVPNRTPP